MKKNIKSQRGAVSTLVVITVLTFSTILLGAFLSISALRKSQVRSDIRIQEIYGKDLDRVDEIYDKLTTSYTITYNLNGGTVSIDNPTTYTSDTETFTLNNPTKEGYTFTGWTGSNGDTPQTTVTIEKGTTGNKNFVANWTANSYTVTLDRQNGTTGDTSVTATYGSAMPSITIPTREGYTFEGYYTETEGNGTKYYNADGTSANNWDIASETTLYAKWTINKHTLKVYIIGNNWNNPDYMTKILVGNTTYFDTSKDITTYTISSIEYGTNIKFYSLAESNTSWYIVKSESPSIGNGKYASFSMPDYDLTIGINVLTDGITNGGCGYKDSHRHLFMDSEKTVDFTISN